MHPPLGDKCDSASPCALGMAAALLEFLPMVTFDGSDTKQLRILIDGETWLEGRDGVLITF